MGQEKRLYIDTYGCQMNVSDSEKIAERLYDLGYRLTTEIGQADMIIVNTCSVRAQAEERVYNHLKTLKGRRKAKPHLLLGVGGCVAQQEGERLLEKIPHLNFVFGTHNLHLLPHMVREAEAGRRSSEVAFLDNDTRLDLFPAEVEAGGVTRFVTIMQGCDNFCSYCIVPYVRGREVSRRSADILDEIRQAAKLGVKEVTLLGQNVNSYGLNVEGEIDFPTLLRRVADLPGIERIRFMTSNPKDVSPELIACFAELDKLCSHVHLPAQSGSDRILSLMNRRYTRDEYLAQVAALRSVRPDLQITGDMIVGFPGETEEDFQATISLMREVEYADLFSFVYSVRPETGAARLADETDLKEKKRRLDELQALQRTMCREGNRRLVGSRQSVLVEGVSRRGDQLYGRTSGNRVVNFPGDPALVGSLVWVSITAGHQNSLLGELDVKGEAA